MNINIINININIKLLYTIKLFKLFKLLFIVSAFLFSFPSVADSSSGSSSDSSSGLESSSGAISEVPRPSDEDCAGEPICLQWKRYAQSLEPQESEGTNNLNCGVISSEGSSKEDTTDPIALSISSLLPDISLSNAGAYTIYGTCKSNLGNVRVVIGKPDAQKTLPCAENNTFSGTFDVQNISSHPVTIAVTQYETGQYGNKRATVVRSSSIANNIKRFVTKWNFPENFQFTLPLKSNRGLKYNFTVDWGDRTSVSHITSFEDLDKAHRYKKAGEYTITITGLCEGFQNNVSPLSGYLFKVVNLGNMGWKDLSHAFQSNSSLTKVFGGNTSRVTKMNSMFNNSHYVTPDTSGWDTSGVNDMSGMFYAASQATPDTSGWDTSKVIHMEHMFTGALQATPDTSGWDTSKVTHMDHMFGGALKADPDTSGWNFTNVINGLVENKNFDNLFRSSSLSMSNYSKFLIRLDAKPPRSTSFNKSIHVGTVKYNYSAAPARHRLKQKGWRITDGGLSHDALDIKTIPWLSLHSQVQPITVYNANSYTISGTCNANLGVVRVVVGEPNVQKDVPCAADNTFSGSFDLWNISSESATVSVSQDGVSAVANSSFVSELNERFVTEWQFPSNHQFTLPLKSDAGLNYNFIVDWGDNTAVSHITSFEDSDKVHRYTRGGKYKIAIKGLCEGFQNDSSASNNFLIKVVNLGSVGWKDLSQAFQGNNYLTQLTGGNTSGVTNMSNMFYEARQVVLDTSGWNTSSVTNMKGMFYRAAQATPDTSGWDTSSVTDMSNMFSSTPRANPNTSAWNTSSVTNMKGMFSYAAQADPNTSGWDTSSVTDMSNMFFNARQADPNTSGWKTPHVTKMNSMFEYATLADPDTSLWDFRNVTHIERIFSESGLSVEGYSDFLIGFNERIPTSNSIKKVIDVGTLQYSLHALLAHHNLRSSGWSIMDGGVDSQSLSVGINVPWLSIDTASMDPLSSANAANYRVHGTCNANLGTVQVIVGKPNVEKSLSCTESNIFSGIFNLQNISSPQVFIEASQDGGRAQINTSIVNDLNYFITKWRILGNRSLTLPLKPGSSLNYNFTVDWGDGNTSEVTSFNDSDKVHQYESHGEYKVTIKGLCEGFQNDSSSRRNLLKVSNLGNMGWKDLSKAFKDNSNLEGVFGGNTSGVTNMSHMFYEARKATPETSGWDTSNVTNMSFMFSYAFKVNPDTSDWDTSSVTNMKGLFYGTQVATPDTSRWDTSSVTDMSLAFSYAAQAIPDTSRWDFSNVTNVHNLFFSSGLSIESYSKFLISFDERAPTSTSIQKVIDVSTLQYNSSAVSARANLVSQEGGGWIIRDGGHH